MRRRNSCILMHILHCNILQYMCTMLQYVYYILQYMCTMLQYVYYILQYMCTIYCNICVLYTAIYVYYILQYNMCTTYCNICVLYTAIYVYYILQYIIQWNLSIEGTLNKGHLSNEYRVCCPNHIELCTNHL